MLNYQRVRIDEAQSWILLFGRASQENKSVHSWNGHQRVPRVVLNQTRSMLDLGPTILNSDQSPSYHHYISHQYPMKSEYHHINIHLYPISPLYPINTGYPISISHIVLLSQNLGQVCADRTFYAHRIVLAAESEVTDARVRVDGCADYRGLDYPILFGK